jgi:hypothetical protein
LGVLRWLQTVALPGTSLESIGHRHLLSAMDALVDHKAEVDNVMASLLRPLVDQDLAMVFYDMTTIRPAGLSEQEGDLRHYGKPKEGVIVRLVMLGVVQAAEGLPLYHEGFEGNTAEVAGLSNPSRQRAATVMSLIQSAKLNGHDPYAHIKDVLTGRKRMGKSSCRSPQFLRASCPLQLRWTHAHSKSRNSNAPGRSSARALQ